MLTTNEFLNIEDYAFKSSPESCSGNSYFTDCTDLPSDEDFMQQLSSDLDIPLLLNPGEDELSLLNSFFDKSPEEIMSEIVSPASPKFDEIESFNEFDQKPPKADLCTEIKIEETDSCSSLGSNKSHSGEDSIKFFEIKDELKTEPHSPTNVPVHTTEIDSNIFTIGNNVRLVPNPVTAKKIPIQPKVSTPKKVVVLKNTDFKRSAPSIVTAPPSKVVVLDNLTAVPITTIAQISTTLSNPVISKTVSPVIVKGSNVAVNVSSHIDPKILKRQQRKIKNRESACLSRKKKKDYVTSLEGQVHELMSENQQLKQENQQLRERLTSYEGGQVQKNPRNVKANIVLCMFLFSVAFHLDYIRNPLFSRTQTKLIQNESPKILDHHGRTLLWAEDILENNGSNFSPFSMCPAFVNQTESARLALELERWIGRPKESTDTSAAPSAVKLSLSTHRHKSPRNKRKPKKYETAFFSPVYDPQSVGNKISAESNELQVFSPTPEQLYTEFFEAINRQDDTFYVVSFSDLHMLLPALHHNKTRRPKMSLIMPSVLPSENMTQPTFVPLMQIDCEVLDTRLIQVKYGSIPQHLRKHGNSTYQNNENKENENRANYTKKAYKPYFIKHTAVKSSESGFYNRP